MWILFAIGTSLLTELSTMGLENAPLSTSSLADQLASLRRLSLGRTIATALRVAAPYSPVAVLSVLFVLRNGSIVLGDKEHHQAALHWAQPLYCVAMLSAFAWPALLSSLQQKSGSSSLRQVISVRTLVPLTVLCLAAVHLGTIAHPFLLADNRHFTFYLWRKVINRTSWTRYALAPLYALALQLWWSALCEYGM